MVSGVPDGGGGEGGATGGSTGTGGAGGVSGTSGASGTGGAAGTGGVGALAARPPRAARRVPAVWRPRVARLVQRVSAARRARAAWREAGAPREPPGAAARDLPQHLHVDDSRLGAGARPGWKLLAGYAYNFADPNGTTIAPGTSMTYATCGAERPLTAMGTVTAATLANSYLAYAGIGFDDQAISAMGPDNGVALLTPKGSGLTISYTGTVGSGVVLRAEISDGTTRWCRNISASPSDHHVRLVQHGVLGHGGRHRVQQAAHQRAPIHRRRRLIGGRLQRLAHRRRREPVVGLVSRGLTRLGVIWSAGARTGPWPSTCRVRRLEAGEEVGHRSSWRSTGTPCCVPLSLGVVVWSTRWSAPL